MFLCSTYNPRMHWTKLDLIELQKFMLEKHMKICNICILFNMNEWMNEWMMNDAFILQYVMFYAYVWLIFLFYVLYIEYKKILKI